MGRVLLWILVALAVLLGLAFAFLGDPEVPRATLVAKYGAPPSQFLQLPSGASAHYRDQGNPTGPVLVLLHGSNASLHTWEPWVRLLGPEFRIVTVDLPGHGLTIAAADETYTAESMARFVDAFAGALKLPAFAVGGNSMGGGVAGRVAIQFPQRVSKLILIDSAGLILSNPPPTPLFVTIARTPVLRYVLRLVPTRPIFDQALHASFSNAALVTPEMVDRYWELNRGLGIRNANRIRFTMPIEYFQGEDRFFRANMGKIAVPTLILWGREDKLIPVAAADIFKAAIPGAQAVVFDNAGHILMEDAAEPSAAAVRSFMHGPAPQK